MYVGGGGGGGIALWELYKQTISLKTRRLNMQRRKTRGEKRLQASSIKGYFIHLINLIASAWASFEGASKSCNARYGWMDLRDGERWLRGSAARGDELH